MNDSRLADHWNESRPTIFSSTATALMNVIGTRVAGWDPVFVRFEVHADHQTWKTLSTAQVVQVDVSDL